MPVHLMSVARREIGAVLAVLQGLVHADVRSSKSLLTRPLQSEPLRGVHTDCEQ